MAVCARQVVGRETGTGAKRRFEASRSAADDAPALGECLVKKRAEVGMEKIKEKVHEFVEIAKACPENLQVACFELLLRHHLASVTATPSGPQTRREPVLAPQTEALATVRKASVEEKALGQEDIREADLHVKTKKFLQKNSLSLAEVNSLFYKEDGAICPLYENLGTTKMTEAQIRIALLQALRAGLTTGDFKFTVEEVRGECRDRKCYDKDNFASTMTRNSELFDFKRYDTKVTSARLSEIGKTRLAEVIKELA